MQKFSKLMFLLIISITILFSKDLTYQNNKYNFNVQSVHGNLSLETFKGKILGIYFGYMFCPDVCPTSLSALAFALKQLPKEKQNKFQGLFISVDPQRDKIEDLDKYAKYFYPNFIGSTTKVENINDIVTRYGGMYYKVVMENSNMDYSVAHTSYIYFFDEKGRFLKKVDHIENPDKLKIVLKELIK